MSILAAGLGFKIGSLFGEIGSTLTKPIGRAVDQSLNAITPNVLPDPAAMSEAWKQGIISTAAYVKMMAYHGIAVSDPENPLGPLSGASPEIDQYRVIWDSINQTYKPYLTILEALTLWNRGVYHEWDVNATLIRHGWKKPDDWTRIKQFAKEIPGAADLVHFVLRHGFEPSVIAANRLNEEFPQSAREWFKKQGLNYPFEIVDPFTNQTATTTWADMYWQTHWVPIAPGQAFEMLQRLRPSRIADFQQQFPEMPAFTMADVNRWLRINDYPPGIRQQLAALSYNVLTRRDVTAMFQFDIFDRAEVKEQYQDQGYNATAAEQLTRLAEAKKNKANNRPTKVHIQASAKKLFLGGVIGDDDFRIQFYRSNIKDKDSLSTFDALNHQDQLDAATTDIDTDAAYTNTLLERQLDIIVKMTAGFKNAYLKGLLPREAIIGRLTQLGLANDHILQLFAQWDLFLVSRYKEINAAQAVQWAKDGIISADDLRNRLENLSYRDVDINAIMAKANMDIAILRQKGEKLTQKGIEQQQKQAIAEQKRLAAEQQRNRAELAKYAAPAQLVKWYANDNIGLEELTNRLSIILGDPNDIAKWVKDAKDAKQAVIDKAAKKAGKGGGGPHPPPPPPKPVP